MMSTKEPILIKEEMLEMEIEIKKQHDKVDANEELPILLTLEPLKDHTYFSSSQPKKKKPAPGKKNNSKNKIIGIITSLPTNKKKESPKYTVNSNPNITVITVLHRCTICGYSTTKLDAYKKHQEVHGTFPVVKTRTMPCGVCTINEDTTIPEGCQKCPHCSFTTKNTASLRVHAHTHRNMTSYKCSECPYRGRNMQELTAHLKTAKVFVCGRCPFMSHVKETFLKHQECGDHEKFKAVFKRRTRKQYRTKIQIEK